MKVHYICEVCGTPGSRSYPRHRVPNHFFCSVPCQNQWQTTREDIRIKNRDPEFRKKVAAGLRRRKEALGDNYHSQETKAKIGKHTALRWHEYPAEKRQRLIAVLRANAEARRTYAPYDMAWKKLSARMRRNELCRRCGSESQLTVHHITPVKCGGGREDTNLVVLCRSCHPQVEAQSKALHRIVQDWEIVSLLVRERLGICP